MKVTRGSEWEASGAKEVTVEQAVEDVATPSAYSYEDQIEKIAQENEKLRGVVARLIECSYGESSYRYTKAQQLAYILGYPYEVSE